MDGFTWYSNLPDSGTTIVVSRWSSIEIRSPGATHLLVVTSYSGPPVKYTGKLTTPRHTESVCVWNSLRRRRTRPAGARPSITEWSAGLTAASPAISIASRRPWPSFGPQPSHSRTTPRSYGMWNEASGSTFSGVSVGSLPGPTSIV